MRSAIVDINLVNLGPFAAALHFAPELIPSDLFTTLIGERCQRLIAQVRETQEPGDLPESSSARLALRRACFGRTRAV